MSVSLRPLTLACDCVDAKRLTGPSGLIKPELTADLGKLKHAKIPVDIRLEQGLDVLGLSRCAMPAVTSAPAPTPPAR